jgi:biopolymer transport protein ExbD
MGQPFLRVSATLWPPSRAAAIRAAKRRPEIYPRIDLMAFIGILLAILFLFMGGTGPVDRGIGPDLTKVQNATPERGAAREDAMHIGIMRDGKAFFGGREVTSRELPVLIRDAIGHGSESKIYLTVDRRARCGDVNPVIDAIQLSGIKRVAILTESPSPHHY